MFQNELLCFLVSDENPHMQDRKKGKGAYACQ